MLTDCRLVLLIGTISSLAIAFAFGMAALLPRHEFERIKPGDLAEKAKTSPLLVELNKELTALFAAATSKNQVATDKKLSSVTSGIYAVSVSLFIIVLRAIVEALYSSGSKGGGGMSDKDGQSQGGGTQGGQGGQGGNQGQGTDKPIRLETITKDLKGTRRETK